MGTKKSVDLHDEKRLEAADRAAEEFGSFSAFVRVALDEYDAEIRLEREIEELAEELESKRERLEELRKQDDRDETAEIQYETTDRINEDVVQFYSDSECGSDD
ncbi:MAG: hypothetical protein ABEI77_02310 [Halorientalis sp.]